MSVSWTVQIEDCELRIPLYIGQTRTTLKKELDQHTKEVTIKEHLAKRQKLNPDQDILEKHIVPDFQIHNLRKLLIYEAILILREHPELNHQKGNFVNPLNDL